MGVGGFRSPLRGGWRRSGCHRGRDLNAGRHLAACAAGARMDGQPQRMLAVAALSALMAAGANAQTGGTNQFPSKPIRIIVSSAPGGGQDVTTRPVAQKLGENLGVSVV